MDLFLTRKPGKLLAVNGLRGLASIMVMQRHYPQKLNDERDYYFLRANRSNVVYFFMLGGFLNLYVTRCVASSWSCSWLGIMKRFLRLAPMYYLGLALDLFCYWYYYWDASFTPELYVKASFVYTWYGPAKYAALSFYHWYPSVAFWAYVAFSLFLHGYIVRSIIEVISWKAEQVIYNRIESGQEMVELVSDQNANNLENKNNHGTTNAQNHLQTCNTDVSDVEATPLLSSIPIDGDATNDDGDATNDDGATSNSNTASLDMNTASLDMNTASLDVNTTSLDMNTAGLDIKTTNTNDSKSITKDMLRKFWTLFILLPVQFYLIPLSSLLINLVFFSNLGNTTNLYFFAPQRMFEVFLGSILYPIYYLVLMPWFAPKDAQYKTLFGYIVDLILMTFFIVHYFVIIGFEGEFISLGLMRLQHVVAGLSTCGGIAPFVAVMIQLLSLEVGIIAKILRCKPFQILGRISYETYILHLALDHVILCPAGIPRENRIFILLPGAQSLAYVLNTYITGPFGEWLVRFAPKCSCDALRTQASLSSSLVSSQSAKLDSSS